MKINRIFFLCIIFFIIICAIHIPGNYYHEQAHKQIAIYNGCIDWEISYFFNPHFKCLERTHVLSKQELDNEYMLDSINEIVFYNSEKFYLSLILCFFILCATLLILYEDYIKVIKNE